MTLEAESVRQQIERGEPLQECDISHLDLRGWDLV